MVNYALVYILYSDKRHTLVMLFSYGKKIMSIIKIADMK